MIFFRRYMRSLSYCPALPRTVPKESTDAKVEMNLSIDPSRRTPEAISGKKNK